VTSPGVRRTGVSRGSPASRWTASAPEPSTSRWVRFHLASCTATRGASGTRLAVTAVDEISPFACPWYAAVTATTGDQSCSSIHTTPGPNDGSLTAAGTYHWAGSRRRGTRGRDGLAGRRVLDAVIGRRRIPRAKHTERRPGHRLPGRVFFEQARQVELRHGVTLGAPQAYDGCRLWRVAGSTPANPRKSVISKLPAEPNVGCQLGCATR
jgi:hypothetical protein